MLSCFKYSWVLPSLNDKHSKYGRHNTLSVVHLVAHSWVTYMRLRGLVNMPALPLWQNLSFVTIVVYMLRHKQWCQGEPWQLEILWKNTGRPLPIYVGWHLRPGSRFKVIAKPRGPEPETPTMLYKCSQPITNKKQPNHKAFPLSILVWLLFTKQFPIIRWRRSSFKINQMKTTTLEPQNITAEFCPCLLRAPVTLNVTFMAQVLPILVARKSLPK